MTKAMQIPIKSFVVRLSIILFISSGLACSSDDPVIIPPNVLFITADDLNNDLGLYGHPLVQSPNLDALASQSIVFERAYAQYPVCSPSRSSFLTGLYPEQTGVLTNQGMFRDNIPEIKTLPQWFKENGYSSARVGKLFHYNVPLGIGTDGSDDPLSWDKTVNPRGLDRDSLDIVNTIDPGKYGGTLSWLDIESEDDQHTDGLAALAAIDLLREMDPRKTGKPFFLGIGFYRPHTPFVAPSDYFGLYERDTIEPLMEVEGDRENKPPAALFDRKGQRELSLEQRKEIIEAYYASISFMDFQLGRVLEELDRLGLRESTIIVFLSDHGYHLGQHGMWQKSDLFEGSTRVPLLISVPDQNIEIRTKSLTELVDLYPTLVELTGLESPGHLKGHSLVPILENSEAILADNAYTLTRSRGKFKRDEGETVYGNTIRTTRYRYTEWGRGKYGVEFYDYESDPNEYRNLAGMESTKALQDELAQMLDDKINYTR